MFAFVAPYLLWIVDEVHKGLSTESSVGVVTKSTLAVEMHMLTKLTADNTQVRTGNFIQHHPNQRNNGILRHQKIPKRQNGTVLAHCTAAVQCIWPFSWPHNFFVISFCRTLKHSQPNSFVIILCVSI